jgi:hypothetical protein
VAWLQMRKLAKQKRENEKTSYQRCSSVAVHHFLPDIPNATSLRVSEAATRKGGQRQTRECERQHNSEVAVKKMLMTRSQRR